VLRSSFCFAGIDFSPGYARAFSEYSDLPRGSIPAQDTVGEVSPSRDLGCRVQYLGPGVQGSGFRVQVPGFRDRGSGFRDQGSGIKVRYAVAL
jgi:hypothetical protein